MSNKSINGVELVMVTYGVLIWSIVGAVMFGASLGLLTSSLMIVAKDKIETRKEDKSELKGSAEDEK